MGFLDWLFGRQARQANAIVWRLSDQGNSTAIVGKDRITVFPQDDRRSYCVVDVDDRREPYFSEPHAGMEAAREEVLAHVRPPS